eukprot:3810274-Prorocentrum_lima.AAC.1
MTSSLVGSEMCIRDRGGRGTGHGAAIGSRPLAADDAHPALARWRDPDAVVALSLIHISEPTRLD